MVSWLDLMTESSRAPGLEPPPPTTALARTRQVIDRVAQEGPAEPFRRFLYRHSLYRRLALAIGPRLNRRRKPRTPTPGVTPSMFEDSDLEDYLDLRPDVSQGEIESRLRAGHVCFVIREEGRLIGHSWVGSGAMPLDYLDCTLQLAPDVCQYYDEYTHPDFRRKGALLTVSRMRREYQESQGYTWRVMTFLPENLQAFRRIGRYRPIFVGEIGRYGVGAWQRPFLRLDRELTTSHEIPLQLLDARGRPARVRRVEGPLGLERAFWSRRETPPGPPLAGMLDRSRLLQRRLVNVFDNHAAVGGNYRAVIEAEELTREEVAAYLDLRPDQDRAELESRWRAGHRCFVSRGYGRLMAASWLVPGGGQFADLGCEVSLSPDASGVYDEYVRPSMRRMHVLNPVDEMRSQFALDRGWKQSVSLTPPEVLGAWLRMKRHQRPVVAELDRQALGPLQRFTLHLEPGVEGAALPFRIVGPQGEISPGG